MSSFLEKMRAKPHKERKRFAFISTVALTGIIFIAWIVSLPGNFRNQQAANDIVSPFKAVSTTVASAWQGIHDSISKLSSSLSKTEYEASQSQN